MSDFKVVLADLDALANTYKTESDQFAHVASQLKITPPDSGDGALNTSMKALLDELSFVNSRMHTFLSQDADKLKDCRNKYVIADDGDKNRFLWDNITEGLVK
ncbi:DUF6317 family protein [Mycobacterium sp. MUNTM1]